MMSMKKIAYVTLAIDYVNAKPHIGHAVEKIQGDVLARFYRACGYDTFFLGGADEFSIKNVQAAEYAGMTTKEFVTENARAFREVWEALGVSTDDFIRTTEKRHISGAQKLWMSFQEGDLYKKRYEGWYCVGCEEFKMEKDLIGGRCGEHPNTDLEKVEEENWFFRLSKYQDALEQAIESDTMKIFPTHRKNEMLAFIRSGLQDFSVSRSVERAKNWGVPIPGDDSQVMYVWVDALSNYITALGYADGAKLYQIFWEGGGERTHIIGKGILRFHTVYWPAMLLSAGLPIPTRVYAHEYLSIDGRKISKSIGNVINPEEVLEKYGKDGARYVLLSSLPYASDGDVTWESMTEKYNAELANGLGNLVSRVIKLGEETDNRVEIPNSFSREYSDFILNMRFSDALEYISSRVRLMNKYIDETKPWELRKTDMKKFEEVMRILFSDLGFIARHIEPFMPDTSEKIIKMLSGKEREILFQRI